MAATNLLQVEQSIARCRLVLSIAAFVAMYVDPTEPLLARWIPMISGPFVMDPSLIFVMGAHLAYSLAVYVGLSQAWLSPERVAAPTMWSDVVFGTLVAALTEGMTSPFSAFFAFGVAVVGFRAGLRPAMLVSGVSVALYVGIILISAGRVAGVYIMRPVYLAITGYLVGYLGQQRLELQDKVRELEAVRQRHQIGRDLHDGFMQALAGINLRLETCRRLLDANSVSEALTDLTELQDSVNREYDELRAYMRELAGLEVTPRPDDATTATQLRVTAHFSGSVDLVDHVLQIVREGLANIRRHAHATAATIAIDTADGHVRITIADNGVGFDHSVAPWSITSRVEEIGGHLQIDQDRSRGTHLQIILPAA